MTHLLGDVPNVTGSVESHEPIHYCHFMKVCSLFVSKESIWYPYMIETTVTQSYFENLAVNWWKDESGVSPGLTEIHTDGVIL